MPKNTKKDQAVEASAVEESVVNQEVEMEDEIVEEVDEGPVSPDQTFYDNDGDEILFPDGPKMSLVEEWKSKFGAIYLTEFDEEVFIWHTLSRKEYKDIMKVQQSDTYYKEERICDRCILWPEGYNFLKMTHGKAGIPSLVAEQIMDKSGFTAVVGAIKL
jgi:hypothetical protein